jgi:predicted membrane protein
MVSNILEDGATSRLSTVALGAKTTMNLFHSSSLSNELELNGHTTVSVFGGTRIDFTAAPFEVGETTINVISVFGGTDILIPRDVAVRVTGASIFGGVKVVGRRLSNGIFGVNSYETPGYAGATRRLHIDATSIFGGVKINDKDRTR